MWKQLPVPTDHSLAARRPLPASTDHEIHRSTYSCYGDSERTLRKALNHHDFSREEPLIVTKAGGTVNVWTLECSPHSEP